MRDSSKASRICVEQRGFTLIEVLAALIIVSLGMLGVIEAVSQTAKNGAYLRDKTLAHWVAMNQLSKVRLDTRAPNTDKSSDEVEMADRKWRWSMVVTQTGVQTMRLIEISVAPADAPKTASYAKVTGFYGSAIAPTQPMVSWTGQGPGGLPGGGPPPIGTPGEPPPGSSTPLPPPASQPNPNPES